MSGKTEVDASKARAAHRDKLVKDANGKGWQILKRVASQDETVVLLRAAAKRMKLGIEVNCWDNGVTVTYRVGAVPPAATRSRSRKPKAPAPGPTMLMCEIDYPFGPSKPSV